MLCGIAMSMGFAAPAGAEPVICLTISYRLLGGPTQYVVNGQCFVPSSWPREETWGGCTTVNSDAAQPTVEVCRHIALAHPTP